MQNLVISNSILVELNIATVSAGKTTNFDDVPQLNNTYVHGIQAFTDSHISKTPNLNTVVANAAAKEILVYLVIGSKERLEAFPYYDLIPGNNAGLVRQLANEKINISKSYVINTGTTMVAGTSLVFNFFYRTQPPKTR